MRVVFTYYPIKVRWNHGVSVLSAICKHNGIDSRIMPIDDDFIVDMDVIDPDYIGFSFVTVHDYKETLLVARQLKQYGFTLLAGGVYPRIGGEVDESVFDYVCRGEAEFGLLRFLMSGDDSVFKDAEHNESIDFGFPDYADVTGYEFDRGIEYLKGKKIIPYSSSRGCPYQCTFCATKFQGKSVRIKTTIAEDIAHIQTQYHPDLIYFTDEMLPYHDKSWRRQFVPCNFMSYLRADIDPDRLRWLIDSGLRFCAFGIESGDEHYRNNVLKKGISDAQIFRTIDILKQHNVEFIAYFMTGIPNEPDISKQKTMAMPSFIGGSSLVWQYDDMGVM